MDAEAAAWAGFDLARLDAAIEAFVFDVADVRQAVPLATFLRVVVVENIVIREGSQRMNSVRHGAAAKQRRLGEADLGIQAEYSSGLHQARSVHHTLGRQEIQTAEFIVFAEHTPGGAGGGAGLDGQLVIVWKFVEVHRDNSIMRHDGEVISANRP